MLVNLLPAEGSIQFTQMANFGLSEHQLILEKLCRICGDRLKKAKDKYENSFLCDDKKDMIFEAFGVKIREDDLETYMPP